MFKLSLIVGFVLLAACDPIASTRAPRVALTPCETKQKAAISLAVRAETWGERKYWLSLAPKSCPGV